jgi:hypothetical protein
MHHKLTKHGKFCKQNNQLPTKSHDELEDNSIRLSYLSRIKKYKESVYIYDADMLTILC